jgi:hypothetical protein
MRTRLGFVVTTLALLIAFPTLAEDNPKQALSFSAGFNDNGSIAYRRLFGSYAALLNVGYEKSSFRQSNDIGLDIRQDSRFWQAGVGLRHYLSRQQQVTPFIQAEVDRSIPAGYASDCPGFHTTSGTLGGGGEYHVTKAFSVEGMAGLGYNHTSQKCSATDLTGTVNYRYDSRSYGTFRSGVTINFYF